jgi:hypothetical protein
MDNIDNEFSYRLLIYKEFLLSSTHTVVIGKVRKPGTHKELGDQRFSEKTMARRLLLCCRS